MVVLSWVTSLRLWAMSAGMSAEAALAFLMSGCISAIRSWVSLRVAARDCMAAAVVAVPSALAKGPVMALRLVVTAARFFTIWFTSFGSTEWLMASICARVAFTFTSTGATWAIIWSMDRGSCRTMVASFSTMGLSGEPGLISMAALPMTESLLMSAVESVRIRRWNFSRIPMVTAMRLSGLRLSAVTVPTLRP